MPTTHLLYLHGFRSSPQSSKARMLAARIARDHPGVTWWCPQLPPSPRAAMGMAMRGIAAWPHRTMAVAGSSLGGFYATWVAERVGCKAVLLNPAVCPERDLAGHVGQHSAWHDPGESFVFEPGFVGELHSLQCLGPARPENYCVLVAKGDEVLDWREMAARYPGTALEVLEGGDHALSDFHAHIDAVLRFLDLV